MTRAVSIEDRCLDDAQGRNLVSESSLVLTPGDHIAFVTLEEALVHAIGNTACEQQDTTCDSVGSSTLPTNPS